MIRIGIVGAGGMARHHADGLLALPDARVTSVYDIDEVRRAELAERCGAVACTSLEELVAGCDAVFVVSWTGAHREAVETAARAGRAIFCEKPLAPTMAEARAMLDTVRRHRVVHQVGLTLRWVSGYAVLRALLAEAHDRVLSVTLHTQMGNRPTGWRGDLALAGGGVLLEVGFHDLDLLEWVVGPIASCQATVAPGRTSGIEDAASVALAYESGAVGTLAVSWHDRPTPELPARELWIVCESSQYLLEGDSRLRRFGPGAEQLVLGEEELNQAATERGLPTNPYQAFVRLAGTGEGAVPTFDDAMRVHTLVDAAYRSAQQEAGRRHLSETVAR